MNMRLSLIAVVLISLGACSHSAAPASPSPAAAPAGSPTNSNNPQGCPATAPAIGGTCKPDDVHDDGAGRFCAYGTHVCSCDGSAWTCYDKPAAEAP